MSACATPKRRFVPSNDWQAFPIPPATTPSPLLKKRVISAHAITPQDYRVSRRLAPHDRAQWRILATPTSLSYTGPFPFPRGLIAPFCSALQILGCSVRCEAWSARQRCALRGVRREGCAPRAMRNSTLSPSPLDALPHTSPRSFWGWCDTLHAPARACRRYHCPHFTLFSRFPASLPHFPMYTHHKIDYYMFPWLTARDIVHHTSSSSSSEHPDVRGRAA